MKARLQSITRRLDRIERAERDKPARDIRLIPPEAFDALMHSAAIRRQSKQRAAGRRVDDPVPPLTEAEKDLLTDYKPEFEELTKAHAWTLAAPPLNDEGPTTQRTVVPMKPLCSLNTFRSWMRFCPPDGWGPDEWPLDEWPL